MRNAYKLLVRKPERKRLVGIPRRRWKNNIKMDLQDIILECGLDSDGSGSGPVAFSCEYGI
jgi:hypothetical protein